MTVLHTSDTCTVDHYGPLVIITLTGNIGAEIYDGIETGYRKMAEQYKHFWSLTILNTSLTHIKPGMVDRGTQVATTWKEYLRATAIVITGNGLAAVLARTGLATFSMLDRSGAVLKTYKDVNDALDYLAGSMAGGGYTLTQGQSDEIGVRFKQALKLAAAVAEKAL